MTKNVKIGLLVGAAALAAIHFYEPEPEIQPLYPQTQLTKEQMLLGIEAARIGRENQTADTVDRIAKKLGVDSY